MNRQQMRRAARWMIVTEALAHVSRLYEAGVNADGFAVSTLRANVTDTQHRKIVAREAKRIALHYYTLAPVSPRHPAFSFNDDARKLAKLWSKATDKLTRVYLAVTVMQIVRDWHEAYDMPRRMTPADEVQAEFVAHYETRYIDNDETAPSFTSDVVGSLAGVSHHYRNTKRYSKRYEVHY